MCITQKLLPCLVILLLCFNSSEVDAQVPPVVTVSGPTSTNLYAQQKIDLVSSASGSFETITANFEALVVPPASAVGRWSAAGGVAGIFYESNQ